MSLACVVPYFNPAKSDLIANAHRRFRKEFPSEIPLHTIEVSFDGNFDIHDAEFQIQANENQIMWQKERIFNLAVEKLLPSKYTRIMCSDSDILYDKTHFAREALRSNGIVQCFKFVKSLNRNENVNDVSLGYIAYLALIYKNTNTTRQLYHEILKKNPTARLNVVPRTGFSWIYPREIFPLYDKAIVGGGDSFIILSIEKIYKSYQKRMTDIHFNDLIVWKKHLNLKNKNIQKYFINLPILHLFHGEYKNRQYNERHEILKRHNFNPQTDIRIGENGLYEWSSNKKEMHKEIFEYFQFRKKNEL
jgi:hypothetical protein